MLCEAREKMRMRITLKKKSDHGQFAKPCTMKGIQFPHALCGTGAAVNILPRIIADHLGLQVEPSQELFTFVDSGGIVRDLEVQMCNARVLVDFYVMDIKLNWNSSLLLVRAFLSTVGAVCNLQTNQLCLTLIDPNAHYDPIPVKKPQMSSRRINDPGIIAACHCGAEYETEYSASIDTHTATSIDSSHQKSTNTPHEKSVDSRPDDWENDCYNPTIVAYTRQHMYTEEYDEDYENERATEYKAILYEEDILLYHSSCKRNTPLIDILGPPSIDTQPHQRNRKQASTDIANYSSIDTEENRVREGYYSIGSWADDHHHESYAVETTIYEPGADEVHEGFTNEELLNIQRRDEADQHRSETAIILQKSLRFPRYQEILLEEKDEYGVYRDEHGYARDLDGNTIRLHNMDIRRVLERATRDEPSYICLPEHANLFTQTKLVPEIYTKDKINEMFYGVCGE
ncbi:hypothetical protein IGI04_040429 [Brassica rapa subsp. trilocularis]|uniref:Uncharacterized protein n=1 Tax=Brassica rapa subsp. trilocularis TaxID=1813537 RepID=A0ABQ7KMU2_BRACM|nr:hypothetical protein IGI04_040429 [Brassica rapa subsp. trilocularis]